MVTSLKGRVRTADEAKLGCLVALINGQKRPGGHAVFPPDNFALVPIGGEEWVGLRNQAMRMSAVSGGLGGCVCRTGRLSQSDWEAGELRTCELEGLGFMR